MDQVMKVGDDIRIDIVGLSRMLSLAAFVTLCDPALAAQLNGQPEITDGDTVIVQGRKVRLLGVDAPETDQVCLDGKGQFWSCGIAARDALKAKTSGQVWQCKGDKVDRYSRLLATCFVKGEDVNEWLVHEGWALSFVRYNHVYDTDEKAAREARKGLWRGAFVAPWEWRDRNCKTTILGASSVPIDARRKLCGSPDVPPQSGCEIKANLKAKGGECIYHLPGSHGYGQLSMAKDGRRWFCTEVEAKAAGCRKSLR